MEEVVLQARAKVNLTMDVLSRRADGYHEVDLLMQSVSLCDTLILRRGESLSLTIDGGLPVEDNNLILCAARLLAQDAGVEPCAQMHLEKRVPVAAGLGGGSGDAAAALAGLLTLAIALKGIGQWNTSANDPWLTIYTVLVATTAAKSLSTAIVLTGTTGGILLGAGGLLFFLSDMVLGIWNYQKPHILLADLNWLLYFAGQFMLCAGYIAAVR